MTTWQKCYAFLQGDTRSAALFRIVASVAIVLVLWEVSTATFITNRLLLVPPGEVFDALWRELLSGAVWENGAATGLALLVAFPFAVLVGVAGGLLLASNRLVSLTMGPMLMALYSVPVVALAPLFIAWLGLGFASKFVLVALVAVFPVLVTTEAGLRATDKGLIDAARSFNANGWQVFTTVTLPYSLPYVISGVRVAWARALVGVVVAEFFGSFAGFGFAILAAGQTFDTATLLAYVILLGALGVVGSLFFESLERRLAPWRHD